MSKIDIDKFVTSLMEFSPQQSMKYIKALEDQGLEYKDGEIVEIEQESKDDRIRKAIINTIEDCSPILSPEVQKRMIAWLEKQAQSTTITIPKDLKGTDTDGGVVGEKGEQGEQPTEEEMVGMGGLGKVWSEQAIISRLDKIIELLQSAILPIPRETYVPTTIYKNPLAPDPNTLGGWETTASTEGGEE